MDLSTLIGLFGALAVIIAAMSVGGGILLFVNVPSILIVFCGSALAVLTQWDFKRYFGAIKTALIATKVPKESINDLIAKATEVATIARKDGMLALEEVEVPNPKLAKGIRLLVDGLPPEAVMDILKLDLSVLGGRHEDGQTIFKSAAEVAPAMGMIGTLIGLIQMLAAMDDPKTIGPSMAIALLTTLYGAVLANVIFTPIANKLELRSKEEKKAYLVIMDTLKSIQAGQNPKVLKDKLKLYMAPADRLSDEEEEELAMQAKEKGDG